MAVDWQKFTIPAGSTDPIRVDFDEPFEARPGLTTAWEPDPVEDGFQVEIDVIDEAGFTLHSIAPYHEDVVVQWIAVSQ